MPLAVPKSYYEEIKMPKGALASDWNEAIRRHEATGGGTGGVFIHEHPEYSYWSCVKSFYAGIMREKKPGVLAAWNQLHNETPGGDDYYKFAPAPPIDIVTGRATGEDVAVAVETKEEALARLPITVAGARAYIDKEVDAEKVDRSDITEEQIISLFPIGAYKGTVKAEDLKTEETLQKELVMLDINKDKPGSVRKIAYGSVLIVFACILGLWYFIFKGQRG